MGFRVTVERPRTASSVDPQLMAHRSIRFVGQVARDKSLRYMYCGAVYSLAWVHYYQ
ncbi:uncharacterized protein METZ01_LOCUS113679 [marine metagenome]|uniref:Uncharacterized protein n=1 Tax=marine metagenome TaxID=408172 RepID=A0A381X7T6_9ZZZZ